MPPLDCSKPALVYATIGYTLPETVFFAGSLVSGYSRVRKLTGNGTFPPMNLLAARAPGRAAGGALRVVWAVGGVLPQLSGRRRPGRTGPSVVRLGPVRLSTLPTLAGRPAKRSEPQAATSSRVQAVELRDTGRTPARHGAAGNPPDRWPGFGRPTHPTEDRERDLQRARDRRVRPEARFRTRPAGGPRPAGLRRACRLPLGRSRPATRTPDPRRTRAPVRAHAHARRPYGRPPPDRIRGHPRHRRPPAQSRPSTSKTTSTNPNGAPNRQDISQ